MSLLTGVNFLPIATFFPLKSTPKVVKIYIMNPYLAWNKKWRIYSFITDRFGLYLWLSLIRVYLKQVFTKLSIVCEEVINLCVLFYSECDHPPPPIIKGMQTPHIYHKYLYINNWL